MTNRKRKEYQNMLHILSREIIDSMDMDSLLEYAYDRMYSYFDGLSLEQFEHEWNTFFNEED